MKREEEKIQNAIVDFLTSVAPDIFVHHSPNGGKRSLSEGKRFKRMGTRAGFPDLLLLAPGGQAYTMEIKTATGVLEDAQREVLDLFQRRMIPYAVVRSIDDVRKALTHWKIETKEAKA